MSQKDFGNLESPLSGAAFINNELEPWRDALHTMHSGDTRPSYAVAKMLWLDTTTNPWIINMFTGTVDVPIGAVDIVTNTFRLLGDLSASSVTVNDAGYVVLDGTEVQDILDNLDTFLQSLGTAAFTSALVSASQSEAEVGTENTKFMTPLRTSDALKFSGFMGYKNYLYVRDEKTSGTSGGNAVSGSQRRSLNTVKINNISGATLSSDQVSLPAGTYLFKARCPAAAVLANQAYLRNDTDSSNIISGSSELAASNSTTSNSFISGSFTLTGTKLISLNHYVANSKTTDGLGVGTGSGLAQVFSELEIWKVA